MKTHSAPMPGDPTAPIHPRALARQIVEQLDSGQTLAGGCAHVLGPYTKPPANILEHVLKSVVQRGRLREVLSLMEQLEQLPGSSPFAVVQSALRAQVFGADPNPKMSAILVMQLISRAQYVGKSLTTGNASDLALLFSHRDKVDHWSNPLPHGKKVHSF